MSLPCPRCPASIGSHHYEGVPIEVCNGCYGVLVQQRHLVDLLTAASIRLRRTLDPYAAIQAIPDHPNLAQCPLCAKAMTNFGYLEMNLVMIDRCARCELLWIDPGELAVMCLLYMRTQQRNLDNRSFRDSERRELAHRVGLVMTDGTSGG